MIPDYQWTHLVRVTMDDVYRLAYRVCGDRQAAEAVTQRTYLVARQRWPVDGSCTPGEFRNRVFSICLDLVADASLEAKVYYLRTTSRCAKDVTAKILRISPAAVEDLFSRFRRKLDGSVEEKR
jgi:DNA-directed RNA polymerase specialized sigma24 family protein